METHPNTPNPAKPGARPAAPHANDVDNTALCGECGGLCCMLYLALDEDGEYCGDGWLPEYIALWEQRLTNSGALRIARDGRRVAGEAGIEPLHDPRLSTRQDAEGEEYRAKLPQWVDVTKCQFCHPNTGCLLPRRYRAPICGEWVCELWECAPPADQAPSADHVPPATAGG